MNARSLLAGAVLALAFFALGFYFSHAPAPVAKPDDLAATLASLQAENRELRSVIEQVTTANADLATKVVSIPPPVPVAVAPHVPTPPPMTQAQAQQRAILNNLRQIGAATDQFRLENGRYPTSIDEIVGPTKYVKVLNVVAGEDYRQLNLTGDFSITTADGVTITYRQ